MIVIKFSDIFEHIEKGNQDRGQAAHYILFRQIEDWCYEHIPKGHWRFDHSHTIYKDGVDLPGKLILKSERDAIALKMRFL